MTLLFSAGVDYVQGDFVGPALPEMGFVLVGPTGLPASGRHYPTKRPAFAGLFIDQVMSTRFSILTSGLTAAS
ncbi:hypothetical protein G6F32_016798 [Rhizopus arrhizus]|nr:hypothetical protein G6F32_016798 [Rhizopus arrhizus]